jgi:hypothetical protein
MIEVMCPFATHSVEFVTLLPSSPVNSPHMYFSLISPFHAQKPQPHCLIKLSDNDTRRKQKGYPDPKPAAADGKKRQR